MQSQYDGRAENRGTILVSSSHTLFTDLVGEMVARCGFLPAFPSSGEAPWLSLTRTQPLIVICDCSAPAEGIQQLIVEASSRGIPLVLSDARTKQRAENGSLVLPQRVTWLTFPVSRDSFVALLDEVLRPPADTTILVPARTAGSTRPRRLALVPRDVDEETPESADARDLHSAVAAALAAKPVYAETLRRAVWTYVGAERNAGSSPSEVIVSLTELVDSARIAPESVSRALTGRVVLWCVEAYFGRLGGDIGGASVGGASVGGAAQLAADAGALAAALPT